MSLSKRMTMETNGDVAQLGERRLCKPEVAGSIPVVSTNCVAAVSNVVPVSNRQNESNAGGKPAPCFGLGASRRIR
jgi:hypothetical protein